MTSLRPTDVDAELAGERYRQFTEQVYDSLKLIKEKFHFHFINAEGSREEVKERIKKELIYQSNMELEDDTFEAIRVVPLASDIIIHARHELVRRLDLYQSRYPGLFSEVIYVVTTEFMDIIRRQALAGKAVIRSDNVLFGKLKLGSLCQVDMTRICK